jgi:ABC-type phosphate transport system substrate-binding protein
MRTSIIVAILLALLCTTMTSSAADRARRPLVVVVGKDAKISSLSHAELRRVFTGTVVTAGGQRLVPFNYPPATPERSGFDRTVLGMSPQQVGRFWVDRKVRGEPPAPRALPSAAHVAKVVAKFPGAIGYLPADQVTADVRVVAVDGLRPGDHGYPLAVE